MVDQHGDNHGYMVLRIPAERLIAEKPLRIKVTGSRANLTSWYMTFKKAVAGDFSMKSRVTLDPVKKWKIKFIQHSHTDIGYTRSQTEILAEHLRYIDYALDYCDATDNYPDNAKFRWTCEASWPVDEYLKCRPASQVERLIRRIREGRIEVTGMYFNFDEMFVWPQLSTSTAETFFIDMEKDHSSQFPVIRGAWPDWWTDGFGASARETAATRLASSSLTANEAGLSMAALAGVKLPDEIGMNISLANNALLFYTEHTLGYSESVREPLSQPTMEQRALKESYAWEATRRTASIGEEAMGLLQSLFNRDVQPDADGKSSIIHLRETDGKNALINLKNGLTGKKLKTIEVDVTGKAVINNSLSLAPLESRFYRIYYTP